MQCSMLFVVFPYVEDLTKERQDPWKMRNVGDWLGPSLTSEIEKKKETSA